MTDRLDEPCGLLGAGSAGAAESHVAQQSRRDKLRFQQHYHHLLPPPPQPDISPTSCGGAAKAEHGAGYQLMYNHCTPGAIGSYPYSPSAALYAAVGSQEQQQASAFQAVQGHLTGSHHHGQVAATYAAISSSSAAGCGWVDVGLAAPTHPIGSLPFSNLSGAPAPGMLVFPHHQHAGGAWMEGSNNGGEMSLLPGYACPTDSATRVVGAAFPAASAGGPNCWPSPLGLTGDLPPPNCRLGISSNNNNSSSLTTGAPPHVLALSLSSSAPPSELTPVQDTTSSIGAVSGSLLHAHLLRQQDDPCRNPVTAYTKFPASGSKPAADNDSVTLAMQHPPSAVVADALRLPGPLGPFTGYATILRNSKFLRPAQLLLDESCSLAATASPSFKRMLGSGDVFNASAAASPLLSSKRTSSPGSSSSAPLPPHPPPSSRGGGAVEDCSDLGPTPEIHDKKAKLLFLQAEVCRKYRQYNQQIQMAVSSFESVAGLSSAIPFLSLAIKSMCKHFRFLKHVITDQLIQISRALGEEFVSSSSSKSDIFDASTAPRLKFLEQTLRKQKAEQKGIPFSENRQPVWRPQRGLPERAVAVLRAWLFDHFLHPYPTDADKIMLASQTGLSRNQVSNWFINARVRVWKPMVEEIHKLETKGLNEVNLNSSDSSSTQADLGDFRNSQPLQQQQEQEALIPSNCSSTVGLLPENHGSCHNDLWHQDKRSRMEDVYASSGFGGYGSEMVAGISPYPGGLDMGSFGAVSLTLGLKQDERSWHPQQYQQLRPYFDSQMVHD